MLQGAAQIVHRAFRAFERRLTVLTRHVGPLFVAIAVVLILPAVYAFFEVNFTRCFGRSLGARLVGGVLCLYLAGSMVIFYALACLERPGRPDRDGAVLEKRIYLVDQWLGKRVRDPRYIMAASDAPARPCRKCPSSSEPMPKPARTHHCSVCRVCILKYDHHCPWINQCVGLHNERYFVLFMLYLGFDSMIFMGTGWGAFWDNIAGTEWNFRTYRLAYLLYYLLAFALGLAVLIMGCWHLAMIAKGETSVETQDNDFYRKLAKEKGTQFENPYHLGARRNLEAFFNIGENGYPFWTVLLPLPIPPYTAGWQWRKRHDWRAGVSMFQDDEFLTDEEDE